MNLLTALKTSCEFKSQMTFLTCRMFDRSSLALVMTLTILVMTPRLGSAQTVGQAASPSVKGEVSRIGDSVHVEFQGAKDWNYNLQKKVFADKAVIELTVPALTAESIKQLAGWSDTTIKKISVEKGGVDQSVILKFELAQENIEAFDYLTEEPSKLMVDFYFSKKTESNVKAPASKSGQIEKITELPKKGMQGKVESKESRTPASDVLVIATNESPAANVDPAAQLKGIFDGGDPEFERFSIKDFELKEDSVIRSRENFYIVFPMLKVEGQHFNEIKAQKPSYEVEATADVANKEMRLLLTLFNKGRFNVFLKAVDLFQKKHPRSEYDEKIRFMEADAYYSLWEKEGSNPYFQKAMEKYQIAIDRYPKSPLSERARFFVAYSYYTNGDPIEALRLFQKYVRENPKSELRDRAHLAVARTLLKLNKFDEAKKTYDSIIKEAFSKDAVIEASYLQGDVPYQDKNFELARNYYANAIKKFPESWAKFPNAFYNFAESQFWLGKYKESLETYRDYLKKFPDHPHAGYAMTRVGELLEILGADPQRVAGAYLETFFRYGDTPGASVARLHTLSNKISQMKDKELHTALKEIDEIVERTGLPKIDLFAKVLTAEGLARRHEYENGIQQLLTWYQANPLTTDAGIIKSRLVRHINEKMSHELAEGKYLDVLKTHNQYAEQWLKGSPRIDTLYTLGQAFEFAGAVKEADALYRETLNKIYALKGTRQEKERSVFESLPTEQELNLRLASVSADRQQIGKAYDYLRQIKNPERLPETKQIERVELAAKILEQKGEREAASRYLMDLVNNWKGQVDLMVSPSLKLAHLQVKGQHFEEAKSRLSSVMNLLKDSDKIPSREHAETLKGLGEIYEKTKDQKNQIATWTELLKLYEETQPLASIRYKLGEVYFNQGNVQKAAEEWKSLDPTKNAFWYKLSQEQLNSKEWSSGYKKYIQRIPAMATMNSGGKE